MLQMKKKKNKGERIARAVQAQEENRNVAICITTIMVMRPVIEHADIEGNEAI